MATTIRDLLVRLGVKADTANLERFDRVLGGVASTASRVATAVAGVGIALGAAAVSAVGLAADMEASRLTMRLLIGDEEKAAALMDELIKRAASTPFAQGELIESSKRLLRLTGDNVEENLKLLSVLETMAAVNPTKSVVDATEALLDATSGGGFERLKEFGIVLRADDFALKAGAAGYAEAVTGAIADAVREQTGGEDIVLALSQTLSGRISTFRDTISNTMLGIGEAINKRLGPILDRVGATLTRLQPRIIESVDRIGGSFDRLGRIAGPVLERLLTQIERMPDWLLDIAVAAGAASVALAPLIIAAGGLLAVFGPLLSSAPAAISLIVSGLGALAGIVTFFGGVLPALAVVLGVIVGAIGQFGVMIALPIAQMAALALVVEDFLVTLRGGDSILRRFLDWLGVGEQAVNQMGAEVSAWLEVLRALYDLLGTIGGQIASAFTPPLDAAAKVIDKIVAGLERMVALAGQVAQSFGGRVVEGLLGVSSERTAGARGVAETIRGLTAQLAPSPQAAGVAVNQQRTVNMNYGGTTINGVGLSAPDAERLMRNEDERRRRNAYDQIRVGEM